MNTHRYTFARRSSPGRAVRRWVAFSLLAGVVQAAPSDPNTLLQQGRFREAQNGFEAMAERKPEDPRWRYNAGVAAYRAGDPATAQKHFEAATAASDLGLQQRAWYNLGNSWFEKAVQPEAEDREEALKKAAEALGAAVQLAPQDRAAAENLAGVKQFQEQLRRQEQQEQQDQDGKSDPKKDKDKDQKGQKGQKGQDGKDGKKDANQEQSENSDSEGGGKNSSGKEQASKDQKSERDRQKSKEGKDQNGKKKNDPAGDKPGPNDPSKSERDLANQGTNSPAGGAKTNQTAQAGGDKGKDKSKDKNQAAGESGGIQRGEGSEPAGAEGEAVQVAQDGEKMTVVQARQMLDAQKGSEKPIWTIIRAWGQENQAPANSSGKRRTW